MIVCCSKFRPNALSPVFSTLIQTIAHNKPTPMQWPDTYNISDWIFTRPMILNRVLFYFASTMRIHCTHVETFISYTNSIIAYTTNASYLSACVSEYVEMDELCKHHGT